ncbi:MAG: hypothetical protein KC445_19085, partial [Anaerolineales bacterium]|nr:hypothetical protein [Anaerolineales bacterium]
QVLRAVGMIRFHRVRKTPVLFEIIVLQGTLQRLVVSYGTISAKRSILACRNRKIKRYVGNKTKHSTFSCGLVGGLCV